MPDHNRWMRLSGPRQRTLRKLLPSLRVMGPQALLLEAVLILSMAFLPGTAMADVVGQVQAQTCSALLMDTECNQYLQRLRQAPNEDQRREIVTEYRQLVNERQQLCPLFLEPPAGHGPTRAARQAAGPGD